MFALEGLTCNVGTMFLLYSDLNGYCNVHGHEVNVKDNTSILHTFIRSVLLLTHRYHIDLSSISHRYYNK